MNKPKRFLIILSACFATTIMTNSVATEVNLKPVVDQSAKINESAARSQQKIDRLAEQIDNKLQAFKAVNKEIDGLKVYNAQMSRQIENQLLQMQSLSDSIEKVSVIERQITPLMLRMIDGLKDFVALDVPFLEEERKTRIDSLETMMDRADVAVSEKFRRVLEAYQIEVDYGRTIEAYSGLASLGNGSGEQEVNYLRIGRVALVYQTRDRKQMGIWNQNERRWDPLDDDFRSHILKGLRMAKKQMAPDMIVVPVSAAE
ncbi:DUF3450 domain-containing protein [Aliikangiella marina]|uniref:DUF3450 domain-containing protein n=1 Tax=Aliikangiella marina TaxID=1712262 RepID=A0A545T4K8_9GAMM|nr:DUF3450 domain-containing protein [Aliikangiella marina]TQV72161.1 DUF3450 domain-containing protein [Aliikangiella marina]